MQDILREVQIIVRKGPPDIIFVLMAALRKLLVFGNNQVIAALSVPERPHPVVYLRTSVDAKDDISHLPVAEFHNLIIQENPVRR